MRVHIFDQQLGRGPGHPPHYDKIVATELRLRGIETALYGATERKHESNAAREATPLFTSSMWDRVGQDRLVWALEDFYAAGTHICKDLSSLMPHMFSSEDIAFFPNLCENQIDGICQWIVQLPLENRPTLVLKFSFLSFATPYLPGRPNKELVVQLYRFAMRKLCAAHKRTVLCTDTEEIAHIIGKITEITFPVLPVPLTVDIISNHRKPGTSLNVGFLGGPEPLKGFYLLPDIIAQSGGEPHNPKYIIQNWQLEKTGSHAQSISFVEGQDKLRLVSGELDPETYVQLFQEIDIVLMPYDPVLYDWNSSGVFCEALSAGKVVVVPEKTWLGRQLSKFQAGGTTFSTYDAPSVAAALLCALDDFPSLSQRALEAAPKWRAFHSPASFVDQFLSLAKNASS